MSAVLGGGISPAGLPASLLTKQQLGFQMLQNTILQQQRSNPATQASASILGAQKAAQLQLQQMAQQHITQNGGSYENASQAINKQLASAATSALGAAKPASGTSENMNAGSTVQAATSLFPSYFNPTPTPTAATSAPSPSASNLVAGLTTDPLLLIATSAQGIPTDPYTSRSALLGA
jgi:hypothetical protein